MTDLVEAIRVTSACRRQQHAVCIESQMRCGCTICHPPDYPPNLRGGVPWLDPAADLPPVPDPSPGPDEQGPLADVIQLRPADGPVPGGEPDPPPAPPAPPPTDTPSEESTRMAREQTGQIQCPECPKGYQHQARYENHLLKAHPDSTATAEVRAKIDAPALAARAAGDEQRARAKRPRKAVEEEKGGPWVMWVEVQPGLRISLVASSAESFELACQMATRHEIPFTTD